MKPGWHYSIHIQPIQFQTKKKTANIERTKESVNVFGFLWDNTLWLWHLLSRHLKFEPNNISLLFLWTIFFYDSLSLKYFVRTRRISSYFVKYVGKVWSTRVPWGRKNFLVFFWSMHAHAWLNIGISHIFLFRAWLLHWI